MMKTSPILISSMLALLGAGCNQAPPSGPSFGSQSDTGDIDDGIGDDGIGDDGIPSGPRLDVGRDDGGQVGRDPDDTRDLPVREETCVDGVCTCLRLALLGTLDSAANEKDTRPFVDWLNGNSGGTATVTMVTTKPTLDTAWLSQYDIIVVANVNGWSFSGDEKAAVETWVRETGGGIVALTGFMSTDAEPAASSQLIEFAGLGFVGPRKTAENGQPVPVYYEGDTSKDLKNCLAWTGSSEAIITTPIAFAPRTGSLAKLTFELDYVGAHVGWAVQGPADATVVATDAVTGENIAVAHEVDGTGRIFAFGDEWVIFANQWGPLGNPHNMQEDAYNPCWHPPAQGEPGFHHSVATLYQTKQFWYNAINWVAPPNECGFIIEDENVHIP